MTGLNGKIIPGLETERLILRGIALEDTDWIVLWRSDESAYRYFKVPRRLSKEEHRAWYEQEYMAGDAMLQWMGSRKDTGERIGVFGIKRAKDKREAEISYLLARKARGRGFGGEAVEKVMEWCKENGVERLKATVHEENRDSIRFIERMGFGKNEKAGRFILYVRQISGTGG